MLITALGRWEKPVPCGQPFSVVSLIIIIIIIIIIIKMLMPAPMIVLHI
jgi:hypothetical protein